MPFYPGPGLGGHCIPIDPFYLSRKTKQAGIEARFSELARYINGQMPYFVLDKVQNALNDQSKPLKGSHVPVLAWPINAISTMFANRPRSISFIYSRTGARA
jgi:UDP-N-acetyl-D-glucosamine dehydrogenase